MREHCPSHLTRCGGGHSSPRVRKAWELKCPSRAVRARKRVREGCSASKQFPEFPNFGGSETCHKLCRFSRELGPASVTNQLREAPFFSAPCHLQACTTLNHAWASGHTNVVSAARWAPWNRGNPSTTTSSLLVSNWLTTPGPSLERKRWCELSHLLHGRFWPVQFPEKTLCVRELLPQHTPTGGGQRRRDDGRTGEREL